MESGQIQAHIALDFHHMSTLFAVVEISDNPAMLAVVVFVATLFAVLALFALVWLIRNARSSADGRTTWQVNVARPIHVEKPTFDRIVDLTQRAVERPVVTPETREFVERLDRTRNTLATVVRVSLIVAGLLGIALSVVLFRQADSANMMGLPAGLVLLLGLGALLSGVIPNSTIKPTVEPLAPGLLDKIDVQVEVQPLTVNLSQFDVMKMNEMARNGSSMEDIARAIYHGYERLSEAEKSAIRDALATAQDRLPR
jgi:hypothetical protein